MESRLLMTSGNNPFRRRLSVLGAVLLLSSIAPLQAELPPEAQAAMRKGVIAAQQKDFQLALLYFDQARHLAPDTPEVFYNLGLAEANIPGRELRAIAWFGAYLAVNPNAPNAAAVKQQIEVLEVTNQSKTSRLIKTVQDAADQIHDGGDQTLYSMAKLWAKTGDIAAALRITNAIKDASWKDSSLSDNIVSAQGTAGDIRGAQKTAELVQGATWKDRAQAYIARAQANSGDIAASQKTMELIKETGVPIDYARAFLAEALAKKDDFAGAQQTVELMQAPYQKTFAQLYIAHEQIGKGDIEAAKKYLAAAQVTAALIQDDAERARALKYLNSLKTRTGTTTTSTRPNAGMRAFSPGTTSSAGRSTPCGRRLRPCRRSSSAGDGPAHFGSAALLPPMFRERRLIILGVLLIGTGIGSYFFSSPKEYDSKATYELSRFKDSQWQSTRISGSQLNQQSQDAQSLNGITAIGIVGIGVLLLGYEWWSSRR